MTISFPSVWNGHGRYMLPSLFAVWFDDRDNYQIYQVCRHEWPLIHLTPTDTDRNNPYEFALNSSATQTSRTFMLATEKQRSLAVSLKTTGAWLCRRHGALEPLIPILQMENDCVPTTTLPFVGNVGLNRNTPAFQTWKQAPIVSAAIPPAIPKHVAETLVVAARQNGSVCPISHDTLDETVCVSSCFHIFTHASITRWFAVSRTQTCPVCKSVCALTTI